MSTTIDSLELEIRSNSESAVSGIDALTQSLNKLRSATKGAAGLDEVSQGAAKVGKTLKQASSQLNGYKSGLKQILNANKKGGASFTDFYLKIRTGWRVVKILGDKIWSAIGESNEYIENVNLFTVSMGEFADEAKNYADVVSEAMGIDPSEWIRNQGIFMTLATGFGVVSDRAYTMSPSTHHLQ